MSVVDPGSAEARLFHSLLAHEHYLGQRNTAGDLPAGRQGSSATSCATATDIRWPVPTSWRVGIRLSLPAATPRRRQAAWKCADRDAFLGWDRPTRERNLQSLTNDTRFLGIQVVAEQVETEHVLH
jgi:hypothetical protein